MLERLLDELTNPEAGLLAAGMADEFSTPLTVIQLSLDTLTRYNALDERSYRAARHAQNALDKARTVLDDLHRYAERRTPLTSG